MTEKDANTNRRKDRRSGSGHMDPTRKRWVRTDGVQFVHYELPPGAKQGGEGSNPEWGPSHLLTLVLHSKPQQPFTIDFSMMSAGELEATRKLILAFLAEAQEVCELRDQKAQEAFDEGDDSSYRLYRPVPEVVERKGAGRKHRQGKGS